MGSVWGMPWFVYGQYAVARRTQGSISKGYPVGRAPRYDVRTGQVRP